MNKINETALKLQRHVNPSSEIIEYAFKDMSSISYFLAQGHKILGIDEAVIDLSIITKSLDQYLENGKLHILQGHFAKHPFIIEAYDAMFSHRGLDTMVDNGLIRAFVHHSAKLLKPEGFLVIGAQDQRNFDPQSINMSSDGRLKQKGGPSSLVRVWNEALFYKYFGEKFDIIELSQTEEFLESSPEMPSYLTVMTAKRKICAFNI
jgi:hypothetical protein